MTYSITELAKLAGISTRTLRFYDKKGLLKARRDPKNNYRYYDEAEVNDLQKIMFLRLFDLPLSQIKKVLEHSEALQYQILCDQRKKIIAEQSRLSDLLINLNQTLATMKGELVMNDTEKFAAFKTKTINDNEMLYGKEIRGKYGDNVVDSTNQKFNALSEEEMTSLQELNQQILKELKRLTGTDDLEQNAAKHLFELHKKFLLLSWPDNQYSSKAHKGLAIMYVSDPRFVAYYERETGKTGAAQTLKEIIERYA